MLLIGEINEWNTSGDGFHHLGAVYMPTTFCSTSEMFREEEYHRIL